MTLVMVMMMEGMFPFPPHSPLGGLQASRVISFFGNLTVHDTRELFRRAALYVGAHGAGMTNMIFMAPRSLILEVRPDHVRRRVDMCVCVCVCWRGL